MLRYCAVLLFSVLVLGCGTSDSALRDSGHNTSYIQGFHDGRHSGMQEAGNEFETYIRDEQRFVSDQDYKLGWQDGEREGQRIQHQATSIGEGIAGAYPTKKNNTPDFDKVAKDAIKGVDTSEFKNLE